MEWIDSVGIKVDVPIGVVSHKQGVYRCDEQGRVLGFLRKKRSRNHVLTCIH